MSALLGMIPSRYVSWKGKTFTQITSKIQKNQISINNNSNIIYRSRPLPIYRREIASQKTSSSTGRNRISAQISAFEQPGGYLVNVASSNKCNSLGIESVLDKQTVKPLNQQNEKYCNEKIPFNINDQINIKCLSAQSNALRKTRSSGIIKHKYYTNTKQYLYNRKRTFEQNQFNYLKSGDRNAIPGSAASFKNTYESGGGVFNTKDNGKILNCPVIYKPCNYNYSKNSAVESSTRVNRIKYNALNHISASYKGVYGNYIDSFYSNSNEIPGYNVKDKIGYSLTKVPVIMPDGNMRKCEYVRVRR
jgi:hypothetical protein